MEGEEEAEAIDRVRPGRGRAPDLRSAVSDSRLAERPRSTATCLLALVAASHSRGAGAPHPVHPRGCAPQQPSPFQIRAHALVDTARAAMVVSDCMLAALLPRAGPVRAPSPSSMSLKRALESTGRRCWCQGVGGAEVPWSWG